MSMSQIYIMYNYLSLAQFGVHQTFLQHYLEYLVFHHYQIFGQKNAKNNYIFVYLHYKKILIQNKLNLFYFLDNLAILYNFPFL